ncbi:MAG: hypothetical protein ACFFDP_04515 [Promethearchaeota archaeon]
MRGRTLSLSLLILLVAVSMVQPLYNFNPSIPLVVASGSVPPPQVYGNATDPILKYQPFSPITGIGNSSLLDVIVERVNATDIGDCGTGDLTNHSFIVKFVSNNTEAFRDDLQYNGSMWVALNYSLLYNLNHSGPTDYYVVCYFANTTAGWNVTTDKGINTVTGYNYIHYRHYLSVDGPTFTYIGDTSQTIDVYVAYISSSIWGNLTAVSQNIIVFYENESITHQFYNFLTYNFTFHRWEVDELNVSSKLTPNVEYYIRVFAEFNFTAPFHNGWSPTSETTFTYLGPYLLISKPIIFYVGRYIQLLNITIESVWDSIHGYLLDANFTLTNFSIVIVGGNAAFNGSLEWNATGEFWYKYNLNISEYIETGEIIIGETYYVAGIFNAPATPNRPAINGTSAFSRSFIIDRDPPNATRSFIDPDPPTDEDKVTIKCEVTDDAGITYVILSYYNGTNWVNVTMKGQWWVKAANYTATIPIFPERFVVFYRLYVNDTQNAWLNSSLFNYTVADTPPLIAYISYLPLLPTDNDVVTIYVNITDGTAVDTVTLYYSFDGLSYVSVLMTHVSGNLYSAIIPAYPGAFAIFQFQSILFYIEATDVYGNLRVSSTYAYMIQGTIPALDPVLGLLAVSLIALTVIVLVVLFKIYEHY